MTNITYKDKVNIEIVQSDHAAIISSATGISIVCLTCGKDKYREYYVSMLPSSSDDLCQCRTSFPVAHISPDRLGRIAHKAFETEIRRLTDSKRVQTWESLGENGQSPFLRAVLAVLEELKR